MLSKQIVFREQCTQSKNDARCKVWYDGFLDNYECRKIDEHYVEGQEPGILIPPLACSFSKASPDLMATVDEDGGLIIFNTSKSGALAVAQDWLAHRNAVFDVEWMPGENKLLTASGDQTIALWDITTEQVVSVFRGHSSSVKTVRFLTMQNAVFASGSRDGHVMIWDTRVQQKEGSYQPVNVIRNAHACAAASSSRGSLGSAGKKKMPTNSNQDRQQSVTAVVFQDEFTLISAGSVDGSVKVWDLRKNYSLTKSEAVHKHVFPYAGKSIRTHGFSSLVLDTSRSRLFASCMDNFIYQFDCGAFTSSPVCKFQGHKNSTFYVKTSLSPDDQYLLGGSSDFNAYIWRVDQPTSYANVGNACAPLMSLNGHSNEVTGVAWCPTDIRRLVTLSDDNTVWIWRLNQCRNNDSGACNELGDIVGKTRRLTPARDISCIKPMNYLSHSGGVRAEPKTPRKAFAVGPFQSPAKLSSTVSQTLKTLPCSTSHSPRSSTTVSAAVKVSCSLSKWLGKPSPRKLVLTPKKSNASTTPSCAKEDLVKNIRPGVKRKLCSVEDCLDSSDVEAVPLSHSSSKNQKLNAENDPRSSPIASRQDSGVVPSRVLCSVQIHSDVRPDGGNSKTIEDLIKVSSTIAKESPPSPVSSVFRSPTVDLPNFVLDPQPRTPIGRWPSPCKNRTPDWLTQFRMSRQAVTSPVQRSNSPAGSKSYLQSPSASATTRSYGCPSPVSENRKLPTHNGVSIRKFLSKSKVDK